jgi:hypothetical protein
LPLPCIQEAEFIKLEVIEPKDQSCALCLELVFPFGANEAMINDATNGFVEAMELISLESSRSQDDAKGSVDNMVQAPVDTSFSFEDQQQGPSERDILVFTLFGPLMKIMINCSQECFSMILS